MEEINISAFIACFIWIFSFYKGTCYWKEDGVKFYPFRSYSKGSRAPWSVILCAIFAFKAIEAEPFASFLETLTNRDVFRLILEILLVSGFALSPQLLLYTFKKVAMGLAPH